MILKKIGRTRTAAQRFTDCLELGTVYDPEIRRKCLEQLKEILEVILIMIFPRVYYISYFSTYLVHKLKNKIKKAH